jgi:hypothetical protein
MAMKQWQGTVGKSKEIRLKAIGDRRLVMIFEDPRFYKLLEIQHATPITWMVSSQWNVAWLSRLLTSPSGGVCGMALWSKVLASDALFSTYSLS